MMGKPPDVEEERRKMEERLAKRKAMMNQNLKSKSELKGTPSQLGEDDLDAKSYQGLDTTKNELTDKTRSKISDKKEDVPEEEKEEVEEIFAERFDFTFTEYFYKHNVQVDEWGERLSVKTDELARIVSKEGLLLEKDEEEQEPEESVQYDEEGNEVKIEKPIIPVKELLNVYYFQLRIDGLDPIENNRPNITVGVCRAGLKIHHDISRTNEIWAINLRTGDKLTNRRWKEYYPIDQDQEPRLGYFICGSIIGVLVDQDRGTITFYKDGNDMGHAFV